MHIVMIIALIQTEPLIIPPKPPYYWWDFQSPSKLYVSCDCCPVIVSKRWEFEIWSSHRMCKHWRGFLGYTRLSEKDFFAKAGYQEQVKKIQQHQCITKLIGAGSVVSIISGFIFWRIGANKPLEDRDPFSALGWGSVTFGSLLGTWALVRTDQNINSAYLAVKAAESHNAKLPVPTETRQYRRWRK